jgi:hypothetical protein
VDDTGLHWDTITEPFKDFVDRIFNYLPRVAGAIVLFIVFWLIAKILSWVVRKALKRSKVDERLAKNDLVKNPQAYPVANGVATAVFWIVWLCFIPAVIGILQLEGLTGPVESMFEKFFSAIPNILAAGLVLVVAFILGNLLAKLVTALLTRAGFNSILVKMGLAKTEPAEDKVTPSKVAGYALFAAIVILAATGAAEILNWETGQELIRDFLVFAGQVVLGILVIALGIFLATVAGKVIRNRALGLTAQAAILVLAVGMGLRAMGFANEIVIIGFGAIVGAVAVAFALAFGLGGRETAGKEFDRFAKALRSEKSEESQSQ